MTSTDQQPSPDQERASTQRLGLTEWLSIAQFIALLLSGVWVAFVFFRFEAKERDVALDLHQLEVKKANISLSQLTAKPLVFDQDISIWPFSGESQTPTKATGAFGVDYHFSVTNNANQKIKVAMLVIHALSLASLPTGDGQFYEVPAVSVSKDSPWHREISRGYLADGEEVDNGTIESSEGFSIVPSRGETFVGDVESGQVTWGSLSLVVSRKSVQFIGFRVDAFVRFQDNSTAWIGADQYARLLPGDYPGSPLSPSKVKDREKSSDE